VVVLAPLSSLRQARSRTYSRLRHEMPPRSRLEPGTHQPLPVTSSW
jgi:hypothetical protein